VGLDLSDELRGIRAPVLLISGDRDGVSPPDATRANAEAIADAQVVLLDDCAHIVPWERPDELERAARPFLQQHAHGEAAARR
jgi:pimeloyl-ACP methyl ester carboxylesterase